MADLQAAQEHLRDANVALGQIGDGVMVWRWGAGSGLTGPQQAVLQAEILSQATALATVARDALDALIVDLAP